MPKKPASTSTAKKRTSAPLGGHQPTKRAPRKNNSPAALARRARIAEIRARTSAARAERAAFAKDAELGELAKLPVMITTGPPRARPSWRTASDRDDRDDRDDERASTPAPVKRQVEDIYFIKPKKNCGSCKRLDHPGMTCKELTQWIALSQRVLRDEVTEVDENARAFADMVARAPKKKGRRPKVTQMTEEELVRFGVKAA